MVTTIRATFMSSLVAHQVKDQFVTAVALVTTMVQVQSLAWELMHAMRMVKKKKKLNLICTSNLWCYTA